MQHRLLALECHPMGVSFHRPLQFLFRSFSSRLQRNHKSFALSALCSCNSPLNKIDSPHKGQMCFKNIDMIPLRRMLLYFRDHSWSSVPLQMTRYLLVPGIQKTHWWLQSQTWLFTKFLVQRRDISWDLVGHFDYFKTHLPHQYLR